MDEFTADAFANRDEPLPLLTVTHDDVDLSSEGTDSSRRSRLRRKVSRSRLQGKAQEIHAANAQKGAASPTGRPGLQDRLFNKILEQVIPVEDQDEAEEVTKVDRRSSEYVSRPAFSLTVMSNNFRRFNARIGIVFVFQNRAIRLFTWKTTTHTLSFLAVYTFVCLDPYLIIVLPLAVALLFIMVPAFITRHPPPPPPKASAVRSDQFAGYSYSGPPIAPAPTIRPAAETSKDFFRNMRDLQNSMSDFSNLHDTLVKYIAPATNFSDEVLSSTVFLYLFLLTCILFIFAHLLPFRAIFLIAGYALTISGHPTVQIWLVKQQKKVQEKAAQYSDTLQVPSSTTPSSSSSPTTPPSKSPILYGIPIPNNPTTRTFQQALTTFSEITLTTEPETAEVEIFELQHRSILPPGATGTNSSSSLYKPRSSSSSAATEWKPHLFTPTPYDPLSPLRISGSRPTGTRFFEDVRPPPGWTYHTPKWELDLEAGEWVNDRLIVGVEYDLLHHDQMDVSDSGRRESVNADFGGWVWDLPPPNTTTSSGLDRDDEVWLAYGDYNFADIDNKEAKDKAKKILKTAQKKAAADGQKDWEEQIKFGVRGRTGEWRRRRWVRVVRRKQMIVHEDR
ncbi:Peroxisome size and maintenance regulator [Neophaeococcomyces mojaviensis]|uniref:Peroxisome size and maintenance regulator n=1 Tax=Neophaeococcomyces mojaviensis TaxID=3383035 RepID=A0ACC2ZV76_9EURO|nr:Peroxisome size and maintenance regulator [Knufia sp. JES_112]